MTITENLAALGSWEIDLQPTIPRESLDALAFFGHVAIIHGRVDPATYGDSLLTPGVARYVGVLRENSLADDARTNAPNDNIKISGVGMAFWLGDDDSKGAVIENATTFASGSAFPTVIRGLLPASGSVTEGALHSVPGTYGGTHQWQTPRDAIKYVCATMSTPSAPVNWRVNNNATLDAGLESDLFVTSPQCAIVARGDGEDMALRGIPGSMNLDSDMDDYSTRVVLLAEGDGASIATGSADLAPGLNPYRDLHGNPLKLTRMVSESDTTAPNANTRAQLALAQYTSPNQDLTLGIQDYDVEGAFNVGDYIYAYDPDKQLIDPAVEITFRGQRLNPIALQVVGIQWPVTADYTVAYRAADGTWIDLTPHIEINDAGTYITVGSLSRQLASTSVEPVGSRPNQDTSIPGVPVLVTPFVGAAYLDSRGFTRARVTVQWNAPLNVDGSTILDGDHYEIRYAVDTDMIYPATWSQVSQIRWMDMQTWAQPFAAPTGHWQTMVVAWDQGSAQLQDLSPGVGYDVQIRAVDSSGNKGAWSGTTTFVATSDNIPPSTPAAPAVAASRIAVQITHTLGRSSGGTYNLESDLDHLEVHGAYEPTFTPTAATLLGKLKCNAGMIQAQIAAVGTYTVESTAAVYVRVIAVDISGNRSGPSDAASATALLIDDAHISDLTVSKVTAGTIAASWVMAGEIKTADTGPRMRISSDGFELYNAADTRTMYGATADGSLTMIGQLRSTSGNGGALVVNPPAVSNPEIRFYSPDGTSYSRLYGLDESATTGPDASIKIMSSADGTGVQSITAMLKDTATMARGQLISGVYQVAGGQVTAANDSIKAGWNVSQANERTYYADAGGLMQFGKFRSWTSDHDAFIANVSGDTASTITTLSVTYAFTMVDTPFPVFSANSSSTVGACWVSAYSTTGFTVTRGTAGSSFRIGYWAIRTS